MNIPILDAVQVDIVDRVAEVRLNRPERLNALSVATLEEIIRLASWLHTRDDVRVVRLSGNGRAFSAGFDLEDFTRSAVLGGPRAAAETGRRAAEAWTNIPQISIAAIHGYCIGGGLVLAAACDLRFAADDAVFSVPEVDLGIPLAWGGIPRLVREIGPALTKELVLTCRRFGAVEAKSIGFLNGVVAATGLLAEVDGLASNLAAKPQYALRTTKQQVNAVTEEMVGTARNAADADGLVYALHDEESKEASSRYLAARQRRG